MIIFDIEVCWQIRRREIIMKEPLSRDVSLSSVSNNTYLCPFIYYLDFRFVTIGRVNSEIHLR